MTITGSIFPLDSDRLAARRSGVVQWFGEVVPWNEEVDGPWVEA